MATFKKISGGGAYVDKASLRNGDKAKLVTEAMETEGTFGSQIVAKMRIKGDNGEAKNFALNAPTRNALIEAFGEDSKSWCNQVLTVYAEESRFAGKKGIAAYLIPEGFDHWDDDNGYLVIGPASQKPAKESAPKDTINDDDIPF